MNQTVAQGQAMCASQLRAIMTADDEFGATMQLLADRGVLDNTLVIFSSDNGYMWGEHGRTEKFVPYEPSIRVPLLVRWPGHIPAGTNTTRMVGYVDLLPTMLQAAGVHPAGRSAPAGRRVAAGPVAPDHGLRRVLPRHGQRQRPTWKMVRTADAKYIQTYNASGAVIFPEYYNLTADPTRTSTCSRRQPGQRPAGGRAVRAVRPAHRDGDLRRQRLRGLRPVSGPGRWAAAARRRSR